MVYENYVNESLDDDILDNGQWVPIKLLRDLANVSVLCDFNSNVWDVRDKIINVFSSAKSITGKTTRFPDKGIYCFLNHPSLRDNFADMLIAAYDNDLRYSDSTTLRQKLMVSLNKLSKIVYSMNESTRAEHGCYNQKTFESAFKLTWNAKVRHEVVGNKCNCIDCTNSDDCKDCQCQSGSTGCNDGGCNCKKLHLTVTDG